MSEQKECPNCGRRFQPVLRTHLLCRVCFHERSRDYDMALAEEAWRSGYRLGFQRGHADGVGNAEPFISLGLLDAAIALCHPDRHPEERFHNANGTTAALLAARKRLREAA